LRSLAFDKCCRSVHVPLRFSTPDPSRSGIGEQLSAVTVPSNRHAKNSEQECRKKHLKSNDQKRHTQNYQAGNHRISQWSEAATGPDAYRCAELYYSQPEENDR